MGRPVSQTSHSTGEAVNLLRGHGLLQVHVERAEELLGGQVALIAADQHREVLGHLAAFDGLDDNVFERLREADDLRGAVELATMLEPAGPREDGRDRVGRGGLALLCADGSDASRCR